MIRLKKLKRTGFSAAIRCLICWMWRGLLISRVIYAAAILHDIGKSFQYEERIPHEIAGEKVASEILDTLPEGLAFSAEERRLILAAVRGHREKKDGAEPIAALFYDSDKRSRTCFSCPAEKECNWKDEEKNKEIII